MSGSWVLFILILLSSLPVIAVYVWFRLAKYQFSLYRFLFALLAGAAAFFPALLLQEMLPFSLNGSRMTLFYQVFVRIAFTEELSRLFALIIFFWISARITSSKSSQPLSLDLTIEANATGLVAGLGFALIENAVYAASDITTLPLRLITTAAVHAACGARIGSAAVMLRSSPTQAILRIFTATAIHGIYNMMVTMPGFSQLAAVLIAASALATVILTIIGGWSKATALDNHQEAIAGELDKNSENY